MTPEQLDDLETKIIQLRSKVYSLGGWDAHAENEMIISDALMRIVQHLKEKIPRSHDRD